MNRARAVSAPTDSADDMRALTAAVFGEPAPWIQLLLSVRDSTVSLFGLKTTRELRRRPGTINFFRVESVAANELVVGENDRHLDFRTSLMRQISATSGGEDLIITTVVHCHNFWGRAYLALILPFHKMVVRSSLQRAAAKGWPRGARRPYEGG